jgi:hypothetical protein
VASPKANAFTSYASRFVALSFTIDLRNISRSSSSNDDAQRQLIIPEVRDLIRRELALANAT